MFAKLTNAKTGNPLYIELDSLEVMEQDKNCSILYFNYCIDDYILVDERVSYIIKLHKGEK